MSLRSPKQPLTSQELAFARTDVETQRRKLKGDSSLLSVTNVHRQEQLQRENELMRARELFEERQKYLQVRNQAANEISELRKQKAATMLNNYRSVSRSQSASSRQVSPDPYRQQRDELTRALRVKEEETKIAKSRKLIEHVNEFNKDQYKLMEQDRKVVMHRAANYWDKYKEDLVQKEAEAEQIAAQTKRL